MKESDIQMGNIINVASLLDGGRWSTYQKLITVLAAVVTIFGGFDIQILAFAILLLSRSFRNTAILA